jgi:hypothetical protein
MKIKKVLDLLGCDGRVIFEHYDCYSEVYVWCILERYCRSSFTDSLKDQKEPISVMSHGGNEKESLECAVKLLKQVEEFERKISKSIPIPLLERQTCNGGYYREFVLNDIEVEYTRKDKEFVVTGINRKTKDGWYWIDEPYPVEKSELKLTFQKVISNGELWTWDDIGPLCGSRGEVIVKDGKVIMQRMTAIS